MPRFNYEAKKGPKEVIKGTVDAENQEVAIDKLHQMGYVPIRIFPAPGEISRPRPRVKVSVKQPKSLGLFKKVRPKDLTIFTEQLASLLKSRVPVLEAMGVLYEQTEKVNFKRIIQDLQSEIKDGKTLSQALSKYPHVFPPLYINMIESGEIAGVLDKTLMRLAEFRNKQEEIKAKVSSALAYPIFIILVGIVTVFILLGFVIPRMSALFNEIGQTLPLPTRLLLSLSNQVKNYWYVGLAVIGLAFFMFRRSKTGQKEKAVFDRLKLKLPLLGNFIKKSILARFSRTFGLLLSNGIPIFQAIKITVPTVDNEIFKSELNLVHKGIIDGMSLEQSMKKSKWFPTFMTNMLAVGEKGGNLEESLLEVAEFYEREVDKMTRIMTSLLEPAIILIMSLIVGFIVFAMLLPIFEINLGM